MYYYPFHIGDFRSGTVNMSRHARWIYRDMLDVYYDTEKPLTLDLDELCNEIGAESEDEHKIVERLLRFKFVKTENGYSHEICDQVIAEYHAKADTARTNGKLGGRPKKGIKNPEKPSGFQSGSNPVQLANPDLTGSEANQEPITNNHKETLKPDAQHVETLKPKRKCRLPDSFQFTPEIGKLATDYWSSKGRNDLLPADEFEKFRTYHTSHGKPMLDWDACWRTWYTNAITFNKPQFGANYENPRTPAEHKLAVTKHTFNYDDAINF